MVKAERCVDADASHPGTPSSSLLGMLVRKRAHAGNEAAMATKPAAKEYKSVPTGKVARGVALALGGAAKQFLFGGQSCARNKNFAKFAQASSSTICSAC